MERWEILEYTFNELKKYFNKNVNRTLSIYSFSNQLYISMGRTKVVPPLSYVLEVLRVMVAASYAMQMPFGAWRIASEIPDFVDWKMMNKFAGEDSCSLYTIYKDKVFEGEERKPFAPQQNTSATQFPSIDKVSDETEICNTAPEIYTIEEYKAIKFRKPSKKVTLPEQLVDLLYGDDNVFKLHLLILEEFGKKQFKTGDVIKFLTEKAGEVYCANHKDRICQFVSGRMIMFREKNMIRNVSGSKRLQYLNIKWD